MRLEAKLSVRRGTLTVHAEFVVEGIVALVGPTGAGKTTCAHALLGAITPHAGQLSLGHRVLCDVARAQHTPIEERGIGFLPQRSALFSHLTVAQNVAFGQPDATVVKELLRTFELDAWAQRRPGSLSAGEQQRVSLARALAARPEALILDEPLSALDVTSRAETRRALGEALRAAAKPTLLITHDPLDVIELADRVIVLENGRITQQGTRETLQAAPATAFVSAFVAAASHRH